MRYVFRLALLCTILTAAPAFAAERIVTCDVGDDCKKKWTRTLEWVKKNTNYPVITQTDSLIETDGPHGLSDQFGFTVTKKPSFKGPLTPPVGALPWWHPEPTLISKRDTLDIVLFTRCNNWFGCTLTETQAHEQFANFVIGAAPQPNAPLGAEIVTITPEMARNLRLAGIQGVAIMKVQPNSFAEKTGLMEGDIITHFDGKMITGDKMLNELISITPKGRQAPVDIIRGRVKQTLTMNF